MPFLSCLIRLATCSIIDPRSWLGSRESPLLVTSDTFPGCTSHWCARQYLSLPSQLSFLCRYNQTISKTKISNSIIRNLFTYLSIEPWINNTYRPPTCVIENQFTSNQFVRSDIDYIWFLLGNLDRRGTPKQQDEPINF